MMELFDEVAAIGENRCGGCASIVTKHMDDTERAQELRQRLTA